MPVLSGVSRYLGLAKTQHTCTSSGDAVGPEDSRYGHITDAQGGPPHHPVKPPPVLMDQWPLLSMRGLVKTLNHHICLSLCPFRTGHPVWTCVDLWYHGWACACALQHPNSCDMYRRLYGQSNYAFEQPCHSAIPHEMWTFIAVHPYALTPGLMQHVWNYRYALACRCPRGHSAACACLDLHICQCTWIPSLWSLEQYNPTGISIDTWTPIIVFSNTRRPDICQQLCTNDYAAPAVLQWTTMLVRTECVLQSHGFCMSSTKNLEQRSETTLS